MSVKMRMEVEKKIVGAFVNSALAAGYRLSVSMERGYDIDNMGDCGVLGTTDKESILREAFAGDDCHIFVHENKNDVVTKGGLLDSVGWVYCVYGNDGWDVISDYTTNLDSLGLMAEAKKISKQYAD